MYCLGEMPAGIKITDQIETLIITLQCSVTSVQWVIISSVQCSVPAVHTVHYGRYSVVDILDYYNLIYVN